MLAAKVRSCPQRNCYGSTALTACAVTCPVVAAAPSTVNASVCTPCALRSPAEPKEKITAPDAATVVASTVPPKFVASIVNDPR